MGAKLNISVIKLAMVDKCMNMPQLASASSVSIGTLNRFFKGACSPRLATVGKIAKALGVDVTEIVSFD